MDDFFSTAIKKYQTGWRRALMHAVAMGIPTPAFQLPWRSMMAIEHNACLRTSYRRNATSSARTHTSASTNRAGLFFIPIDGPRRHDGVIFLQRLG